LSHKNKNLSQTERIVTLFVVSDAGIEPTAAVCVSTHGQTDRQTMADAMPCHGIVVANLWCATPCHATTPQWCRPLGNGVPTEAFKTLLHANLETFHKKSIIVFWNDPDFNPDEWHQIKLCVLPKKGDLSDPNKWRGIALGDIASKRVSSVIAHGLAKHLRSFGVDKRHGSIFDKGCQDATFWLKLALQTLQEHDQEACAFCRLGEGMQRSQPRNAMADACATGWECLLK
jgi:hypothetical protein